MKDETNNEMDVLLRRLARRDSTLWPNGGESGLESEHLDADELNAYSENSVPARTRLRYTQHLAECSQCRRLVAQLMQSAGVEVTQVVDKPQASRFASLVERLLSPFTLRYALPVLAAVGLLAIGLIVLRRDRAAVFTAADKQSATQQRPSATTEPSPGVHSLDGDKVDSLATAQPSALPSVTNEINASVARKTAEPVVADNKSPDSAGEKSADIARAQEPKDRLAAAPVSETAPPAPSVSSDTVAKLDDAERQKRTEELGKTKQAEEDRDQAASRPAKSASVGSGRVDELNTVKPAGDDRSGMFTMSTEAAGQAATRGRANKKENSEEESKNESETRSVAGRTFRKRGNIWMDTAYNSSIRTSNITRGSESYRALIADEPEIKTIAEQLQGDIVVVWKGQGYRIR